MWLSQWLGKFYKLSIFTLFSPHIRVVIGELVHAHFSDNRFASFVPNPASSFLYTRLFCVFVLSTPVMFTLVLVSSLLPIMNLTLHIKQHSPTHSLNHHRKTCVESYRFTASAHLPHITSYHLLSSTSDLSIERLTLTTFFFQFACHSLEAWSLCRSEFKRFFPEKVHYEDQVSYKVSTLYCFF